MFRRYECGCIGLVLFEVKPDVKRILCVRSCDVGEREHTFFERDDLALKSSRELTSEECETLLATIGELVRDGYALRELRMALSIAGIELKKEHR
jgi:hypothetical protein